MDTRESTKGEASLDSSPNLREHRRAILAQIDLLERATQDKATVRAIYTLKEAYNGIMEKIDQLEASQKHLIDPLEALPPDLWSSIFMEVVKEDEDGYYKYPVDTLLDLTMVSKAWRVTLISIPILWTHIFLDKSMDDYLAKAVIGVHFSGSCELTIDIRLPLELWRQASSMIIPEGRRIKSLSLRHVYRHDAIKILQEITDLPILRHLKTPRLVNDQEYYQALARRIPSLEIISPRDAASRNRDTVRVVKVPTIRRTLVESLASLPSLQTLSIKETGLKYEDMEVLSEALDCSLKSITAFLYSGPAFHRSLRLVGTHITQINAKYVGNQDVVTIFAPLSRFPHLSNLRLSIRTDYWESTTTGSDMAPITLNSVKLLSLMFYATGPMEQNRARHASFFQTLALMLPRVEDLELSLGYLGESALNYIEGLANLRKLRMSGCDIDASDRCIVIGSVKKVEWYYGSTAALLDKFHAHSLRDLHVRPSSVTRNKQTFPFPRHIIRENAFPDLTSLTISVTFPTLWELQPLYNLRILEMYTGSAYGLALWASDILEVILMRPRDTPRLQTISIRGILVEWDILMLMLERKNLLAHSGVSLIKTVIVDIHEPSYSLLYPISELLKGRFIERGSISQFSVEAVSRRLCDPSPPGCMRCCYVFRGCDSASKPVFGLLGTGITAYDLAKALDINYTLPSEDIVADPPLAPGVAEWLTGRLTRRKTFVRQCEGINSIFNRDFACRRKHQGRFSITGHSLFGATFVDEVEKEIRE